MGFGQVLHSTYEGAKKAYNSNDGQRIRDGLHTFFIKDNSTIVAALLGGLVGGVVGWLLDEESFGNGAITGLIGTGAVHRLFLYMKPHPSVAAWSSAPT